MKPTAHRVLALWQQQPAWKATLAEVRDAIGASRGQSAKIKEIVSQLVAKGALVRERHRYRLSAAARFAPDPAANDGHHRAPASAQGQVGFFSAHPNGFGFVDLHGEREGLFIPARHIAGALDGDRVRVATLPARAQQRPASRVTEVVQRRRSRVRGRLQRECGQNWVVPLNEKLPMVFLVQTDGQEPPPNGTLVEVEITAYPERHDEAPEGRIAQVFADSADSPAQVVLHILADLGLSADFSPASEAELAGIERGPPPHGAGRRDLRALPFVTIDGKDARDFDDAVCLQVLPRGKRRLLVAIADVAAFLPSGSALDADAYDKGTSVYVPDRVLPMLPKLLSNDLCSLQPGQPRLTLTCEMELGPRTQRLRYQIYESLIESKARLNYAQVQRYFEAGDAGGIPDEIAGMLNEMRKLAAELRAMRDARGVLDFAFPEYRFELNRQGFPRKMLEVYPSEATRLIEQFMLEANEIVAGHCEAHGIPILYRVHDPPPPDQVKTLAQVLWNFGIALKEAELRKPGAIQALLRRGKSHPRREQVELAILRAMSRAQYRTRDEGHFALAAGHYTHFTSPIRRYPDLLAHRALKASLHSPSRPAALPDEAAEHLSACERTAAEAEARVDRLYKVLYMEPRLGEEFAATVIGVSERGAWVRLRDEPVEGLLAGEDLPGKNLRFDRDRNRLVGRANSVGIGDRMTVMLARAERLTQRLDFSFVRWGWEEDTVARAR